MDNQHRKITGYRELTEDEIAQMNTVKNFEAEVLKFLDSCPTANGRWKAIAKTQLQQGFMAAGRAIARPDGYD